MRILVNLIRMLLGLTLVSAALIKITDSVGFSYLLSEYLALSDFIFEMNQPVFLVVAVFIILIEFITGVMLLLGYAFPVAKWGSFFITLFYSSLAVYPALFAKKQIHPHLDGTLYDDPIKLFTLSLFLLILSIFIFGKRKYVKPIFKLRTNKLIVFISFIVCLLITYRVIRYLPLVDRSAYKVETDFFVNTTRETLQLSPIPSDSIPDKEETTRSIDTLSTTRKEKVLIIVSIDLEHTKEKSWETIAELIKKAGKENYEIRGLTASSYAEIEKWKDNYSLDFPIIKVEKQKLSTMVRANPEIYQLEDGIIKRKVHWLDAQKISFDEK